MVTSGLVRRNAKFRLKHPNGIFQPIDAIAASQDTTPEHADGIMKPVRAALQALLDLFPRTGGGATPQIGTKGKPGPLYGVSSHAWAALGVAVTASHQMEGAA